MAWKKAYPSAVVKKTSKAVMDAYKVKLSEKDIDAAVQNSSSIKDLAKQLEKKCKNVKAADLEKTLKGCGF